MAREKQQSIEEMIHSIEDIVSQLERGDITLEESFNEYVRGMKLVKSCNDKIDRVEKKIVVLSEEDEDGLS